MVGCHDTPEGQCPGALHGSVQAATAGHKAGEACQPTSSCSTCFSLCCQCVACQNGAASDEWQHATLSFGRVNKPLKQVGAVPLQVQHAWLEHNKGKKKWENVTGSDETGSEAMMHYVHLACIGGTHELE